PPMPSWALPTGTISIGITSHRESRCRTRSLNRSMAGSGTKCSTRPCSRASPTPGLPCENGEPTIMEIAHTRGSAGSPQPNTQPPLPHDGTWRCAQWPAPRQPPSSTRLSRAKTTPGVYVTLDKRWGQRQRETVINPINKCSVLVVPKSEYARFNAAYISLRNLARVRGQPPHTTLKNLKAAGITPISEWREHGAIFFLRSLLN